jgi:hypothetical protein
LRYERDGRPTGAVESWRLTSAAEGYRFLRVDLDAREAPSGRSYLYHVALNPAGRPEQLKYRFWGDGQEIAGSAVWEADQIIATRQVRGVGHEDLAYEDTARGSAFWFPSGAGLALLDWCSGETDGVTLLTDTRDPARLMSLVETQVSIEWGEAATEDVGGELLPVRPLHVAWTDQRRVVWLDVEGRPLRLWRDDGLTAAAERLVRYSG